MANITIRHGDSLDIVLGYTVNGETIYEGDCEELEFYFGGNRYTLTGGTITWSATDSAYMISLSQEDTFSLPDIVAYQLRVKKDEKVGASEIELINIGKVISQEVL